MTTRASVLTGTHMRVYNPSSANTPTCPHICLYFKQHTAHVGELGETTLLATLTESEPPGLSCPVRKSAAPSSDTGRIQRYPSQQAHHTGWAGSCTMPMAAILATRIVLATISRPSTHNVAERDSHLPSVLCQGLALGAWCFPWGQSNLATDRGAHLRGTVQAFIHPLPLLMVASQGSSVGGRERVLLVVGASQLFWAGLSGSWT